MDKELDLDMLWTIARIPKHEYIDVKAQKAVFIDYAQALITKEKNKLLEDIRATAYSRASLELATHAPGVIVDTNKVKWDIFENYYFDSIKMRIE